MPYKLSLIKGGRTEVGDGIKLSYLEQGSGPSILIIHPGWGSALDWLPVAGFLSGKYRVILVDRRNHGSSGWSHVPATLQREAEDVLDLCRTHGPVLAVVGHSAGGLIALHAAIADREEVFRDLILYDPAVSFAAVMKDALPKFRAAIENGEYEQAMSEILPSVGVTKTEEELIKRPEFWPRIVARAPQELDFLVSASKLPPGVETYSSIQKRTLLFYGANSLPALRERAQRLVKVMPHVTSFLIEGQGHLANAFSPKLLADKITQFLESKI